jgi:beta-barrel assembly-enhancing protease
MSRMRKKLIPAEFMVASSLLLAPSFVLTGYAQSSPQNSPQTSPPATAPASAPATTSTPPAAASTPPADSAATPDSSPAIGSPQASSDPKLPGVKQGSIDDVNAVGTRDIGGRGMGNWYSTETEIRMGKSYAMQLQKSVKFIEDPVVVEYVNRIAQNLVKNSDAKVPFTIKVIDSDEVNAMALPGGFMYVNSGLILTADDEAEMAGVIAHEISHVAAHHAVREQTRMNYAQLGTIPLIFIGGWTGYGIYEAAQIGIPLTFLQFSRGFEAQADFLGVQYMYRAGYDPQAFVTIFEKLENLEKTKPHLIAKAFSSHPQTPDRIEATQKEIATLLPPRAEYVVTTSEFDDVKARLARIENKRKLNDGGKGNQPTLRRASTSNNDPNSPPDSTQPGNDRPTLQRRDDN